MPSTTWCCSTTRSSRHGSSSARSSSRCCSFFGMDRESSLRDFEKARGEWEAAFEKVPDAALTYLKPGDDYSLGGLQVHVNWVLEHYNRVLNAIVAASFEQIGPQDPPGAEDRAR